MGAPTHYLKKRDALWNPRASKTELSAHARDFLRQERYSDALDFFQHAQDEQGLAEIKAYALQTGDTFLLGRLYRFDKALVTEADWKQAEVHNEKIGRPSMAELARKQYAPPPEVVKKQEDQGEKPIGEL
ncbi:MAG: hypothetical protein AMXMBFR7_09000 [Planctomycetota bacterium]